MKQNKKRFSWLMAAAVVLAAGIVVCAVGYFSVKAENDRLQEELLQAEENLQAQEALAEEAIREAAAAREEVLQAAAETPAPTPAPTETPSYLGGSGEYSRRNGGIRGGDRLAESGTVF